jgi:hypothetical protein
MNCSIVLLQLTAAVLTCVPAFGDTFTVTNTDDAGAGSLRDVLTSAQNCAGSPHSIVFNVPTGSLTGGVAVITPLSPLPAVTCSGTVIDGTTQTASQGNTNNVILGTDGLVGTGPDGRTGGTGDEAVLPQLNGPEVEIIGSNLSGSTLVIQADSVTVRGLSIHGGGDFSGVGASTGSIAIQSGAGSLIEENVIGASAASYSAPAGLAQTQSNLILITGGGTITIQRNLMGFARWRSLLMFAPTDTVTFQQNEVTGSFDGIDYSSPGVGPTGVITVTQNLIHDLVDNGSGSTVFGLFITQTGGASSITENTINNAGNAVIIDVAHPVTVQNNILSNGTSGISAVVNSASMPATISENSIFGHENLGIDLGSDGVTLNDAGDTDGGPNNLQNFPVITAVSQPPVSNVTAAPAFNAGSITISGVFNSRPSTAYRLEFFDDTAADPSGFGEGQFFLGFADVTTDTGGNAIFNVTLPPPFPGLNPSRAITATATDPDGNTSEFSRAFGTKLQNISTRLNVLTGENVLIGGFIITGDTSKEILLRAIGPSLGITGLSGVLADPVLELHKPDGTVVTNDNWKDTQQAEIEATTIPPSNDLESAILATLDPGAYTAIVSGKDGGTGIGLVEAYDLDQLLGPILANISTRGFVDTGDNAMIGGFIVGPTDTGLADILVRAIGPSLGDFGIDNPLLDPLLELHDSNGAILTTNDNWKDTQETEIEATGLAPNNDSESAILQTLAPGAYTAIVRGADDTTGVGLVEVYNLPNTL